ncbi:hypothetical protein E2C01_022416 [Portunus trituberculatus]|uniref:Uncharacterized protein n=1 Tax=Portunus trituberculatus TaxID=210409 RepID=A0A5B7E783_PORTR|nr:hypothetical protein [Portunus trituberculatus]
MYAADQESVFVNFSGFSNPFESNNQYQMTNDSSKQGEVMLPTAAVYTAIQCGVHQHKGTKHWYSEGQQAPYKRVTWKFGCCDKPQLA